MTFRKALVLLAAATVLVIPNIAQAGGRGHGHGKGWGFGGFPAFAMKHHGHGKATSRAARDRSTRGVAHAMDVVGTTPASKHSQALDALQTALDRTTLRGAKNSSD